MKCPRPAPLIAWSICLIVAVLPFSEAVRAGSKTGPNSDLSLKPRMKQIKIGVVRFAPLPLQQEGALKKNERVFTGELYTEEEKLRKFKGYVVPEEYLDIVHDTLTNTASMHGIVLHTAPSIQEVLQHNPDIIVLGAVESLSAAVEAQLSIRVQLLGAPRLNELASKTISKHVARAETPFSASSPLHTIGHHGSDFHPQRTLVSLVAYECARDLLLLIDQEI